MWRGVETGTLRQGADLLEMQSGCDRGDVDRLLSQKRCLLVAQVETGCCRGRSIGRS